MVFRLGTRADPLRGRDCPFPIDSTGTWDQSGHGFAVTSNHDLFAVLNPIQQRAERILRLEGSDLLHIFLHIQSSLS